MGRVWVWWMTREEELGRPDLFDKFTFAMFVLSHCLDGILTYKGVSAWGLDMEANLFLVWAMSLTGIGLGLAMVKIVVVVFGGCLYLYDFYNTILILTVYGVVFAIIPWTYLFLTL